MEVAYAAEAGATTAAVLLDAARVAPHLNAVAPALTCPDGGQAGRDLGVSELVAAAAAAASAVAAAQAAAAAAAAAFRGAKGYLPPLSPLSRVRRGPYCGRHDGLREPAPTNLRTHRFRARTGGQRGRTGTDAAGTGRRASAPVARAPGSSKVRLREGELVADQLLLLSALASAAAADADLRPSDDLWEPAHTPTRCMRQRPVHWAPGRRSQCCTLLSCTLVLYVLSHADYLLPPSHNF